MKRYESYRESGVEWLGKIPVNWDLVKLKYVMETKSGSSINAELISDDFHIPVLGGNGILGKSQDYNSEGKDIIIGRVGAHCGNVHLMNGKKWVTDNALLIKSKISEEYLAYVLRFLELNRLANTNAQPLITGTIIKEQFIVLPKDKKHLFQITNYLNHKTQIIDALIEKKEQLIKKLQAQRQAIINEAVTKGLNPNAKLKDSGVEWLGEIPEHWEVKRTKYLLNEKDGIKIGPFGSALKLDTLVEKGIKIYGQGNVIKDDFKLGHRYLPLERFEENFQQYEILEGDILVTMMGTTGKSKVFNNSYERGILDSHLLRLRFNENLFNGYLFSIILQQADYIFQQISFNSVGSIMAGLNSAIIKKIKIITPPLNEQLEVLEFINIESKKIDSVISKSKNQIKKLKAYRQSTISEAVTGKIDVRDWQAPTKN